MPLGQTVLNNLNEGGAANQLFRSFAGTGSENIFANGFENAARAPEFAQSQVLNYDRAHRLTSITGIESYQYDAHGRRVLTTRTSDGLKRYQLYSNAGVLMHTEDQRISEVIDYVNLEGQLVAERSSPLFGGLVTTRYQHADLRGSPTVVSSAGGLQVERSIEQPFGAPYDGIYRDGPGFTGHATDAASGLTYMQQRYYDPVAGRFLSVDPEQSEFSRYSYGANNPFKFVDPDGRENVLGIVAQFEDYSRIDSPSTNDLSGLADVQRSVDLTVETVMASGDANVIADVKVWEVSYNPEDTFPGDPSTLAVTNSDGEHGSENNPRYIATSYLKPFDEFRNSTGKMKTSEGITSNTKDAKLLITGLHELSHGSAGNDALPYGKPNEKRASERDIGRRVRDLIKHSPTVNRSDYK